MRACDNLLIFNPPKHFCAILPLKLNVSPYTVATLPGMSDYAIVMVTADMTTKVMAHPFTTRSVGMLFTKPIYPCNEIK